MSKQIKYKSYDPEVLKKLHIVQLKMLKDIDVFFKKYGIRYFAVSGTALGAVRHKGYIPWDDDIDIAILREDYLKLLEHQDELQPKYTLFSADCKNKYYNFVPIISLNDSRMIVPLSKDVFDTGIFIDVFLYENIPDDPQEAKKYISKCFFWRNIYVMSRANFELLWPGATFVQKCKYTISRVVRFFAKYIDPDGMKVRKKYLRLIDKYYGKTNTYTVLGDPYANDVIMKGNEILPNKYLLFEDFQMPMMADYLANLERKFGPNYMEIPPEDKRVNHCPYILEFRKGD